MQAKAIYGQRRSLPHGGQCWFLARSPLFALSCTSRRHEPAFLP